MWGLLHATQQLPHAANLLALRIESAPPQQATKRSPHNNHSEFGSGGSEADFHAAVVASEATFAAARITSITLSGWESIGTWLLSSSYVVAPMRLAMARSRSGCTVWSFLPTIYQLGFDFQAVPPTFASN